jgi:Fe-S-cluster containining protein
MNSESKQNPPLCEGCGVCCKELGTPPFLGFEVFELPSDLKDEVLEKGFGDEREGKPCYWWDPSTKRCTQYANRPRLCQEFEAGSDSCLGFREFYNIQ